MNTQIEHLPNELLLIVFSHLNGLHLYLAFFNLNVRFNRLLKTVSAYQSLDLTCGSISYNEYCAYIRDNNGVRSSFIKSLKFDCFGLSAFRIHDLFACFMTNHVNHGLQRITLVTRKRSSVKSAQLIIFLQHMMIANEEGYGRLEHVTLTFGGADDDYFETLIKIIKEGISFPTMIFNVSPRTYSKLNDLTGEQKTLFDFHIDNDICRKCMIQFVLDIFQYRFPTNLRLMDYSNLHLQIDNNALLRNTVHLSLTLQFSCDMVLILQKGVLPLLQHLHVIFKRTTVRDDYQTRFNVDERDLLNTDTSRLHTLSLNILSMECTLNFLRFLRLTQLETLYLFNIFDQSKSVNNLVHIRFIFGYKNSN